MREGLFFFGVLILLWSLYDNLKNPEPPEEFTWTGLLLKTLFILFFYVLFSVLFRLTGG